MRLVSGILMVPEARPGESSREIESVHGDGVNDADLAIGVRMMMSGGSGLSGSIGNDSKSVPKTARVAR